MTIPLGFLGCVLGTLLSSPEERTYDELRVRSETGIGTEAREAVGPP